MTARKVGAMDGGVADLLAGIGSATPGPLFLVDDLGRSHALNALAKDPSFGERSSEAFMSPVTLGPDRSGHIVGYAAGGHEDAAPLVSALVALTAQVVTGSLGEGRAAASDGTAEAPRGAALERAALLLSQVGDESAVGEIVTTAAREALGARAAILFVRADEGGALEPLAASGIDRKCLGRVRPGRGLLGHAAEQSSPTVITSFARLPEEMTRHGRGACPVEPWIELPMVVVPLMSGPQLLGLLCVSGLQGGRGREAVFACASRVERLTDKAAASLAGSRMRRQVRRQERVQREMEIARQIQRSLLPVRCLAFPGLDLAGECRPAAQVGGDYYGFRTCGDDRLAATVFDVAGHGIGAAFCMTLVRSALHGELARGGDPAEVLTRANALIWEDLAESGLHATAFLARFDRRRGVLEYASAGHSRPIHWSAQRHAFVDRPEGGLPLGMFADSAFPAGVASFSPDDLLVLYTDGIVEAEDGTGRQFGRDRLMGAVHRLRRRAPAVVLRQLWRALEAFTGGKGLRDDATLVVVRGARGFGQPEEPRHGRRLASGMAAHLPMFTRLGRAAGRALVMAGTNLRPASDGPAGGRSRT